jgi:hypothetical protein
MVKAETHEPLPQRLIEDLARLRQLLHGPVRNAVFPVAGSGLSRGLDSWDKLLRALIQMVPEPDQPEIEADLQREKYLDVGGSLELELGPEVIAAAILSRYQRPEMPRPEVFDLLANLPVGHFATTNYDPWLKEALAARKKTMPRVYTPLDQSAFSDIAPSSPPLVLMLHGDADRPEGCVLSAKSYRRLMHGDPAYREGLKSLVAQRHWLFVGHSLRDPDFTSLFEAWVETFGSAGSPGAPRHFFLGAGLTNLEQRRLLGYGVQPIEYGGKADHSKLPAVLRLSDGGPGRRFVGGPALRKVQPSSPGLWALWGRRQREAELFGSLRGSTSPQAFAAAEPPTPANGTTDSEVRHLAEPPRASAVVELTTRAPAPLRPRLLVAGPRFGLSDGAWERCLKLWREGRDDLERAAFLVREELQRSEGLDSAQIAAIVRYDVIVDLSPWGAFRRWSSIGFRNADEVNDWKALSAPLFFCACASPGAPKGTSLRAMGPELRGHLQSLLPHGLAVCGLSEEAGERDSAKGILNLWPEAGVLVDERLRDVDLGRSVLGRRPPRRSARGPDARRVPARAARRRGPCRAPGRRWAEADPRGVRRPGGDPLESAACTRRPRKKARAAKRG